jgi:hypothetical protein
MLPSALRSMLPSLFGVQQNQSPLMALGTAPLLPGPPVLEGPGPLDIHAAVAAASHNLELMHHEAHTFPEAPAWGGLASARQLNSSSSTSGLHTPQMTYRDGSTTPRMGVYRQISNPELGSYVPGITSTTTVTRQYTPRQYTPRSTTREAPPVRVLTRDESGSGRDVPSVPAGARTPQMTPRGMTTPPHGGARVRSVTPSRSSTNLHAVTTYTVQAPTTYTYVNPPSVERV